MVESISVSYGSSAVRSVGFSKRRKRLFRRRCTCSAFTTDVINKAEIEGITAICFSQCNSKNKTYRLATSAGANFNSQVQPIFCSDDKTKICRNSLCCDSSFKCILWHFLFVATVVPSLNATDFRLRLFGTQAKKREDGDSLSSMFKVEVHHHHVSALLAVRRLA